MVYIRIILWTTAGATRLGREDAEEGRSS